MFIFFFFCVRIIVLVGSANGTFIAPGAPQKYVSNLALMLLFVVMCIMV